MKNKISFLLIPLAAAGSLTAYRLLSDTKAALQVLVILVVIMLIVLRKANINSYLKYKLFQNLLYSALTFFVILLVITTGGFLSPFFILIHLTTLGFAFMFSLSSSIIFLSSAIIVTSVHLYFFFPVDYASVDNVLLTVYVLSLVTIVPISFFIARRYDVSKKLSNYLSRELLISQTEKTLILGSIQEGVISIDPDLKIHDLNSVAQKLIKLDLNTIQNKQFFEVFSFRNKYGAEIKRQDFQLDNMLNVQASLKKESLIMNVSNGITLKSINATFSSSVDNEGKVTGVLILFNDLTRESAIKEVQNVIEVSFKKFLGLPETKLKKAMTFVHLLYQYQNENFNETSQLSDANEIIKKISQNYKGAVDLLFDQKIQKELAIGHEKKIATNASIHPLSIATNRTILEKALFCLIDLAATLNPDKKKAVTIDSRLQDEILIIINIHSEQIPQNQIEEITKPFFGQLENHSTLQNAVGLEGYAAKIFLESIGGNFTVEEKNGLAFKVTLPYLRK